MKEAFLQLVRLSIGASNSASLPGQINWPSLKALAKQQGLAMVVFDGLEKLAEDSRPSNKDLLQWIGETLQAESRYAAQKKAASEMALLFHKYQIRTYVLKGEVVAECYPKPEHRYSADFDCYLLPAEGDFDAWQLGNDLIRAKGFDVDKSFYKNSTFHLSGLTVENHLFFTPFRGNRRLALFEKVLEGILFQDKGVDRFDGTYLYRPPVLVSALFLIEHAYAHFLHEGLTWRHILDWMLFCRKHKGDVNWVEFDALIEEFGFLKFYNSYLKLGNYLLGEIEEQKLDKYDNRMLTDVWSQLDIHETVRGVKGKLALVGNTWRARWKYRDFTDITWLRALWIQVKGVLFIKEPQLEN